MSPCQSFLPPELLDRIVDFLHADWRSLVACIQAGLRTQLAPCAQFHLADVSIPLFDHAKPYTELQDFLHIFSPKTPFASLPSSLSIHGDHLGLTPIRYDGSSALQMRTDPLAQAVIVPLAPNFPPLLDLSHFSHLHILAISHVRIELPARFTRFLCGLPSLNSFSLSNIGVAQSGGTGTTRLVRDVGPSSAAIAALRARLKTLCIVETDAEAWSYGSLFSILAAQDSGVGSPLSLETLELRFPKAQQLDAWLHATCHASLQTLTSLNVTFISMLDPDGESDGAYQLRSCITFAHQDLFLQKHPRSRLSSIAPHSALSPFATTRSSQVHPIPRHRSAHARTRRSCALSRPSSKQLCQTRARAVLRVSPALRLSDWPFERPRRTFCQNVPTQIRLRRLRARWPRRHTSTWRALAW